MDAGRIREGNVEALAYTLMGIGHFLALRWLIWPGEEQADHSSAAGVHPAGGMPPAVFDTVMRFISRGLEVD
jgi:hypothetical protein